MSKADSPQGPSRDRPVTPRVRMLEEIEFEVRQWYAGDYHASECAERIIALFEHGHEEAGDLA